MFVDWNVDTTTSSAASPFWYPGFIQSHEVTPLGSVTEVQSGESQVFWHPTQREINSNLISSSGCYSSRPVPERLWPSPCVLNLFEDSTEDKKTVPSRSVHSSYTSTRPSNAPMLDHVEKGNKFEISTGCRLFGINLTSQPCSAAPPEKGRECPNTESSYGNRPVPAALSEADRTPNSDVLISAKEERHIAAEASQETQGKQGCTTSTRSRTKVKCKFFCYFYFYIIRAFFG